MLARDQGTPVQEGMATVFITVSRNAYNPVFVAPETYSTNMAVTFTPSLTVITVQATDADVEVGGVQLDQWGRGAGI